MVDFSEFSHYRYGVKPANIGERLGTKVSIRKVVHPRYKWRAYFIEGGKRKAKYFKTFAAAERWKEEREDEALEHGTGVGITSTERAVVFDTREQLMGLGVSLRDVVEKGIEFFELTRNSETVAEAIRFTIDQRERAGKSERYLEGLKGKLARFEKSFGKRIVATISAKEITEWLHALKLSPSSFNSYRRILGVLFSDAVKQNSLTENPVEKVMPMKVIETRYSVLTPEEATTLIQHADREILPAFALGLFAGVRDSELKKLNWEDIDLNGDEESRFGYVRISASVAKSSRNRLIPITENLSAILTPLARRDGMVWPRNGRKLHAAAKKAAGFGTPKEVREAQKTGIVLKQWPENALRHSYASYHLAHRKNAGELALNLGHTNTSLIFKHYRQLVKPGAAARYWKIGL